jgi:hypothetical protein
MTKTLSHILGLALTVFFCVVAAFPAAAQSTYGSEPLASFNRIGTYSVTGTLQDSDHHIKGQPGRPYTLIED